MEVTVKQWTDIAWGRFSEFRTSLTSTKLSVDVRVRLYATLIVSTMIYGSSAWFFTQKIRKLVNGVNSKMLSQITRRTIHSEASQPTFNIIDCICKRRWSFLGHILRLPEDRAVRRYLLELSPREPPYIDGSLLDDANYWTVDELTIASLNRDRWKTMRNERDDTDSG